MKDFFRRHYAISVKAAQGDDPRAFDVVASTDDVDMVGDVVVQDFDLRRYAKNPVVLYAHNWYGSDPEDSLPVGFGTGVGVVDGKLQATVHFVTADANPLAELCCQGFKQGSLRAVSIGFRSKLCRYENRDGKDVFVLSGNELLEISVCPVPMNPNSVATGDDAEDTQRAALADFAKACGAQPPSAAPRHDTEETTTMKTLLKALGLKDDATETEAVLVARALVEEKESAVRRILEASGAKSLDEAIGVIRAGVVATTELAAATKTIADLSAAAEKTERKAIVDKGVADGKLTPALLDWANGVPIATLQSFLDKAPRHHALAAPPGKAHAAEPATGDATKAWETLTPAEKHNMKAESPETYDFLRADWVRRGQPPMTYGRKN